MPIDKRSLLQSEKGSRYGFVLAGLISVLIAYQLFVDFYIGRLLLHLWLFITMTQLIVSLSVDRISRIVSLCLGSIPLLLTIVSFASNLFNFEALLFFKLMLPLSALFFFFCTWLIICSIFKESHVTIDMIYGSILAYLLIGISWAVIFCCIEFCVPDSFSFGSEIKLTERASALFYFSFVTLTTLGYGDVLPVTGFSRTITYLESIIGVMYPAILVATLVSNFRISQKD